MTFSSDRGVVRTTIRRRRAARTAADRTRDHAVATVRQRPTRRRVVTETRSLSGWCHSDSVRSCFSVRDSTCTGPQTPPPPACASRCGAGARAAFPADPRADRHVRDELRQRQQSGRLPRARAARDCARGRPWASTPHRARARRFGGHDRSGRAARHRAAQRPATPSPPGTGRGPSRAPPHPSNSRTACRGGVPRAASSRPLEGMRDAPPAVRSRAPCFRAAQRPLGNRVAAFLARPALQTCLEEPRCSRTSPELAVRERSVCEVARETMASAKPRMELTNRRSLVAVASLPRSAAASAPELARVMVGAVAEERDAERRPRRKHFANFAHRPLASSRVVGSDDPNS